MLLVPSTPSQLVTLTLVLLALLDLSPLLRLTLVPIARLDVQHALILLLVRLVTKVSVSPPMNVTNALLETSPLEEKMLVQIVLKEPSLCWEPLLVLTVLLDARLVLESPLARPVLPDTDSTTTCAKNALLEPLPLVDLTLDALTVLIMNSQLLALPLVLLALMDVPLALMPTLAKPACLDGDLKTTNVLNALLRNSQLEALMLVKTAPLDLSQLKAPLPVPPVKLDALSVPTSALAQPVTLDMAWTELLVDNVPLIPLLRVPSQLVSLVLQDNTLVLELTLVLSVLPDVPNALVDQLLALLARTVMDSTALPTLVPNVLLNNSLPEEPTLARLAQPELSQEFPPLLAPTVPPDALLALMPTLAKPALKDGASLSTPVLLVLLKPSQLEEPTLARTVLPEHSLLKNLKTALLVLLDVRPALLLTHAQLVTEDGVSPTTTVPLVLLTSSPMEEPLVVPLVLMDLTLKPRLPPVLLALTVAPPAPQPPNAQLACQDGDSTTTLALLVMPTSRALEELSNAPSVMTELTPLPRLILVSVALLDVLPAPTPPPVKAATLDSVSMPLLKSAHHVPLRPSLLEELTTVPTAQPELSLLPRLRLALTVLPDANHALMPTLVRLATSAGDSQPIPALNVLLERSQLETLLSVPTVPPRRSLILNKELAKTATALNSLFLETQPAPTVPPTV